MAENNQEVKVETPKKKRNWLFTLFACLATGIIVYLAINIGNNASKTVDPDVNKSCDKVASEDSNKQTSNSNVETNSNENVDSNSNSTVENNTTSSIDSTKLRNNFIPDPSKNNTDKSASYNITLSSDGYYNNEYIRVFVKSPYTSATIGDKTVKFDKKVIQVLFTGFGQAPGHETIFFLMEDGTVEYIPYKKALTGEMKSYGAIPNVTDVVKLFTGTCEIIGAGADVFGQRADGSFYLLDAILYETGNYD